VRSHLGLLLCVSALIGLTPRLLPAAEPAAVTITVADDHLDFRAGKELVARYQKVADLAKPYLWPVHGPQGQELTRPPRDPQGREWKDHPHQRSAWFCHGDVIPEGLVLEHKNKDVQGVDFWSEGRGHGRIVCTHVGEPKPDGSHAWVKTDNEWRTADGQKILSEARTIHLYDFGAARLFVFVIDLHADVVPITFGDTKEGSFGIRINPKIEAQGGKGQLENADGKTGEAQCWGQHSAWCDYSGPLAGQTVGLAILDHPNNPSPACWHSRGYGLMAANPFGRKHSGFPAVRGKTELVKLAKGAHLKLNYGLLIHPGDARDGHVADYYERFVKLHGSEN
jgi:hypothetical protein